MDLDDELRQLFTSGDERLDVPVKANAGEIIVAGARRVRRRRIVVATASGALAIVLVVVAGIVLAGGRPDAMPPATGMSTTTPAVTSSQVTSAADASSSAGPVIGAATSAGRTTTTRSPSTSTRTTDSGPPTLNLEVLGPTGLRALKLGQSLAEARATGMIGPAKVVSGPGGCATYLLTGDGTLSGEVVIADTVRAILVAPVMTPEHVGPGWTIEQVRAVYPDLELTTAGDLATVHVPQNPAAVYRLAVTGEGQVTRVSLEFANVVDCAG